MVINFFIFVSYGMITSWLFRRKSCTKAGIGRENPGSGGIGTDGRHGILTRAGDCRAHVFEGQSLLRIDGSLLRVELNISPLYAGQCFQGLFDSSNTATAFHSVELIGLFHIDDLIQTYGRL